MGVVLAVKKAEVICMASDSMTICAGGRKQSADHVVNHTKVVQVGSSFIGTSDHPAFPLILERFCSEKTLPIPLDTREEIFSMLLNFHKALKDDFFLCSVEDESDPFESSQFKAIFINPYGIFTSYELRSITEFSRFNAIGSGAEYALGAMQSTYDRLETAREIAETALKVAVEFDDSCGLPGLFYEVLTSKLKLSFEM